MTKMHPAGLKQAAIWSLVLNGGRVLTNTAVVFVIAGILGPVAFGTVAIATIYVTVLQLVFQRGLAPALISRRDVDDEVLSVAFWIAMSGSVALYVLTVVLAGPFSEAFHNALLADILLVLGLMLPLMALDLVPDALARRASNFRLLAIRTNSSVVLGGIVGVTAALFGAGAWALVAQQLLTALLSTSFLLINSAWRPRLCGANLWRYRKVARALLAYSVPASIAASSQYLAGSVDSLLMGLFFGPRAVGLYRLAGRLSAALFDVTVRSGQAATLSDLARRRHDHVLEFNDRLLRIQRATCLLAMPLFGIMAGASAALPLLLGAEWVDASKALMLIALGTLLSVGTATVMPALQALARPGLLAAVNVISLGAMGGLVTVLGIIDVDLALSEQLAVIAGARIAVVLLVITPVSICALARVTGVSSKALLAETAPGFVTGIAAAAAGVIATSVHQSVRSPLVEVMISAAPAVMIALFCAAVFEWRSLRRWGPLAALSKRLGL